MSRLDYVAKALTNSMQVIRGTVHCLNINESSKEEWLHFQQDCSIALNTDRFHRTKVGISAIIAPSE